MNIVKTSQGFVITQLIGNYIFKMHYIDYSKIECIARFKRMVKQETKKHLSK